LTFLSTYKELDWVSGYRFQYAPAISKSPPGSALLNRQERPLGIPLIRQYPPVEFFDLESAHFSCFLENQDSTLLPVSCVIKATAVLSNSQRITESFTYDPEDPKPFVLSSNFTNLHAMDFDSDLLSTALKGVVVIDNVKYTVYKPC
jgi:hypothetical protein